MTQPSESPAARARIGRTIAESQPDYPPRPGAGGKRPNVVVILVDDMGFSDPGCFGSEIPTPAIDSLADSGVRFSNFHVTPLCSPTRASLLTGVNHHRAGYAFVANTDPGVPNRSARFPEGCLSLPEALREAGYATLAVGKWHLTPESEMHDAGDRDMWPCQRGFDRFYGFLEALTTLHHPHRLVRDNSPLTVDEYPADYYLTDDLTDQAIEMIQSVRTGDPDRPFFLYFAHAAVHGPLQAKREDIERFRGAYDAGWAEVAANRLARQKALGIFPEDLAVADRAAHPGREVPNWDGFGAEDQALFARMMSVYAAMIHSVDSSTARIVQALETLGELDDTIIVFLSDNGATAEGGPHGTQEYFKAPPMAARAEERVRLPIDEVGGPQSAMHYAQGWAMVSNTPFRLHKATTHEGGVRSPLVVSWRGRSSPSALCDNYQYVTDLFPTILELAGVPAPDTRQGAAAMTVDGISFAEAVRDHAAPGTRTEQHEEIAGHRSYYSNGWKAVTEHKRQTSFDRDAWQLYRLEADPAEANDLAAERPEVLDELRQKWETAAEANEVFPLDEGSGLAGAIRDPAEARFSKALSLRQGAPTLERFRASRLMSNRAIEGLTSLIGFAPFGGIDVGLDRRSPVSWSVYEQHGSYRYTGTIHSARYVPGELAPDAPQRRIEEMRAAARRFQ